MYASFDPAPGRVPVKALTGFGMFRPVTGKHTEFEKRVVEHPAGSGMKRPMMVEVEREHTASAFDGVVCPGDRVYMSRATAEEAVKQGRVEYDGVERAARELKAAGARRIVGDLTPEAREAARAAGLGVGGRTRKTDE